MISALEPICKETVAGNLKVLFRHLCGGTEETNERLRVASAPAEVRTALLPNTRHKAPQPDCLRFSTRDEKISETEPTVRNHSRQAVGTRAVTNKAPLS
jgi:hypothetical protein